MSWGLLQVNDSLGDQICRRTIPVHFAAVDDDDDDDDDDWYFIKKVTATEMLKCHQEYTIMQLVKNTNTTTNRNKNNYTINLE
jgi:hypothetical protein